MQYEGDKKNRTPDSSPGEISVSLELLSGCLPKALDTVKSGERGICTADEPSGPRNTRLKKTAALRLGGENALCACVEFEMDSRCGLDRRVHILVLNPRVCGCSRWDANRVLLFSFGFVGEETVKE